MPLRSKADMDLGRSWGNCWRRSAILSLRKWWLIPTGARGLPRSRRRFQQVAPLTPVLPSSSAGTIRWPFLFGLAVEVQRWVQQMQTRVRIIALIGCWLAGDRARSRSEGRAPCGLRA